MIKSVNIFSNRSDKKYKGTSLSETLIVITILGIVFTLSMGIIVADYNKNQTVVTLKKRFSVLEQAFISSTTVNSSVENWDFPIGVSEQGSYQFFEKYLKPHLILAQDCKTSTLDTCGFNFKELNGVEQSLNSTWARFYLNDGAFVALQTNGGGNSKTILFYVDINGKKRLNVTGRDIFMFEYRITDNLHPEWTGRLLPYGHEYTRKELISSANNNNCNSKQNGNYCSALIMNDNWQLLEGYPWAQARYIVK